MGKGKYVHDVDWALVPKTIDPNSDVFRTLFVCFCFEPKGGGSAWLGFSRLFMCSIVSLVESVKLRNLCFACIPTGNRSGAIDMKCLVGHPPAQTWPGKETVMYVWERNLYLTSFVSAA